MQKWKPNRAINIRWHTFLLSSNILGRIYDKTIEWSLWSRDPARPYDNIKRPLMILSLFLWTDFSTDAFETFLDIATSHADAAALSIRLLHWTQPRGKPQLRFSEAHRQEIVTCTLFPGTIVSWCLIRYSQRWGDVHFLSSKVSIVVRPQKTGGIHFK
jgi:hypothetical protein